MVFSGCKGFFRRSVRFNKVYECPYDKKCVIEKGVYRYRFVDVQYFKNGLVQNIATAVEPVVTTSALESA